MEEKAEDLEKQRDELRAEVATLKEDASVPELMNRVRELEELARTLVLEMEERGGIRVDHACVWCVGNVAGVWEGFECATHQARALFPGAR